MAVPGGASPGQPDPSSGGIRFTIGITVETAEPVGAYWPKRYVKLAPALPKGLVDAEFFVGLSAYLL